MNPKFAIQDYEEYFTDKLIENIVEKLFAEKYIRFGTRRSKKNLKNKLKYQQNIITDSLINVAFDHLDHRNISPDIMDDLAIQFIDNGLAYYIEPPIANSPEMQVAIATYIVNNIDFYKTLMKDIPESCLESFETILARKIPHRKLSRMVKKLEDCELLIVETALEDDPRIDGLYSKVSEIKFMFRREEIQAIYSLNQRSPLVVQESNYRH